jgi:hypothetical protein
VHRAGVVGHRVHVGPHQRVTGDQGGDAQEQRQPQGLIEDQTCLRVFLAADRLRNQRDGAHAQGLCESEYDEGRIPGRTHTCDRGVSELGHEVQIHEVVERLTDHADRDLRGHGN